MIKSAASAASPEGFEAAIQAAASTASRQPKKQQKLMKKKISNYVPPASKMRV